MAVEKQPTNHLTKYFYLTMKNQNPERELQKEIVAWFRENHPNGIIMSIPNEGIRNRFSWYAETGAVKGAPDLVCVLAGIVFFVENKSKRRRQSPEQRVFEINCRELGIDYHVCRSLEDFKAAIAEEQERFRAAYMKI